MIINFKEIRERAELSKNHKWIMFSGSEVQLLLDHIDKLTEIVNKTQQSIKPKNIRPDYTVDCTGIIRSGLCPTCLADLTNYMHYCSRCGQKLAWNEKEATNHETTT